MSVLIRESWIGRLGRILALPIVAFAASVAILPAGDLILLLNGVALAAAAGVSAAFLPMAVRAFRRARPTRGDVLGAGIFLSGLSDAALRLQSIVARDLGWPVIMNSQIAALSIFLGVLALVAFLWAPHAELGEVPHRQRRRGIAILAAGLAIALAAGVAQRLWTPPPLVRLN